ncbi:hypothetical protein DOTSEDRAFT_37691 [Dothistroma septosporum NZE10]|uniref:Peptidase A1 domain-containing protein n=1 Tax=Dothistroma septosporum (strain NZE10 / CBS 128990) TaxID=675120 RepID=N1PI22_DOTSN|nr:hypothetical protein DOTSEDRAFT_37691 [Dothistroma septosporum NZE10]
MVIVKQLVAMAATAAVARTSDNTVHLAKRSFAAKSHGRGRVDPFDDIVRTHRKFGWKVLEQNAQPEAVTQPTDGGSIEPPAPFSTSSVGTAAVAPTSYVTISVNAGHAASGAIHPTVTVTLPSSGIGASTPTAYGTPIYTNTSSTVQTATRTGSEDGEVTTVPEANEAEYLTSITIGGQKLQMNFDTGSADLWVYSPALSAKQIGGHAVFNPNKSASFELLEGATWSISYGDGSSAGGEVGYDVVNVGGVTFDKQAVELATRMDDSFLKDPNISINTIQPVKQKTFFENVLPDLTYPVFTADLQEIDGTGTYEFGNIDPVKYSGELHYIPVNSSSGFWQFSVPSYKVGEKIQKCSECNPMIADTGTTLVYLDYPIVKAYYEQVKSVQYDMVHDAWLYDCNETLPDLGLNIGGYMATIKGDDLKYAEQEGQCIAGVQQGPGQFQIMGDIILKQFFAVFDGGEERFGIATKH